MKAHRVTKSEFLHSVIFCRYNSGVVGFNLLPTPRALHEGVMSLSLQPLLPRGPRLEYASYAGR